jgi:hypothetical protein
MSTRILSFVEVCEVVGALLVLFRASISSRIGDGVLRRSSAEDCRGRVSAGLSPSSRISSSSGCKDKHGSVDVVFLHVRFSLTLDNHSEIQGYKVNYCTWG